MSFASGEYARMQLIITIHAAKALQMTIITPLAETTDTVTLSRADYETMLNAMENATDIATLNERASKEARIGKEAYRANCLPVEMVERMLAGETLLKLWREHRKLTVAALSTASGVSGSYISEIENGRKRGSVDAMKKLSRALGLAVDDLLG